MSTEPQAAWRPRWADVLAGLAIVAVLVALALDLLRPLTERARRERCADNLREIAFAVRAFHDTYGRFPTQGGWSDHGIAYDRFGEPLPAAQQTAGWAYQILPFLELEEVYETSDVVYDADGLPANVRPLGKGVPFPADYGPAGSTAATTGSSRAATGATSNKNTPSLTSLTG